MATKHRGTDEEVGALNVFIKLMRAANSVMSMVDGQLAKEGLTASQFGTLETLYHLGPLCQRDLGRKLLKSGGNITVVIDNLEKRDLVRRERDTEDRRFITVHLTKTGEELIREVFPRQLARIVKRMDILTRSEKDDFGILCRKLGLGGTE